MGSKPQLLTVREVSQILRINRPKVYILIETNFISGTKVGSDWRIRTDSVERVAGPIPEEFFVKGALRKNLTVEQSDSVELQERLAA